jgi:hypothetical protein
MKAKQRNKMRARRHQSVFIPADMTSKMKVDVGGLSQDDYSFRLFVQVAAKFLENPSLDVQGEVSRALGSQVSLQDKEVMTALILDTLARYKEQDPDI